MGILFQQVIAADQHYVFSNDQSSVMFDFHNDSPYNMGVAFGADPGSILGCHIYTSPQSIIYGLPVPSGKYSVGGSRFSGQIYIYTQTPIGGSTDFTASPAKSITVIGYPAGAAPGGTTSLSRMSNLGNSVPLSSSATSITNDGNTLGTTIVESTPAGKPQAVLLDNSGNLTLGDTTNNAGILTVHGAIFTSTLDAFGVLTLHNGSTSIAFTPTSGNALNVTINGAQVFQINVGGIDANILAGGGGLTGNVARLKNGAHTVGLTPDTSGNLNVTIDGAQVFQINAGGIDTNLLSGGGGLTTNQMTLVNGTNTVKFSIDASGNVAVDRPSGTRNFAINAGGIDLKTSGHNLSANQVVFGVGSISALSMFTGAATGTYSHGLGAIPDIIIPMTSVNGSQTMGYDTLTSTQCHITSAGGLGFKAIAIKQ